MDRGFDLEDMKDLDRYLLVAIQIFFSGIDDVFSIAKNLLQILSSWIWK